MLLEITQAPGGPLLLSPARAKSFETGTTRRNRGAKGARGQAHPHRGAVRGRGGHHWNTVVSVPVLLGAVAVAVIVGALAGLYPARRASRLSPSEALRTV